eukprot:61840_1
MWIYSHISSFFSKNKNKNKGYAVLKLSPWRLELSELPQIPDAMKHRVDKNIWVKFQEECRTASIIHQKKCNCYCCVGWLFLISICTWFGAVFLYDMPKGVRKDWTESEKF